MSAQKKKATQMAEMPDVAVYAVGLCGASVCVKNGTPIAEIERESNIQQPTGIGSRWQVSKVRKFADGKKHPCPCPDHPDERTHRLLEC